MGKGMKFPGMGGLGNMQGMLQKVQKMQGEIQARTFEATVGGGAVSVVMSGKKELQSVKLAPSAVDPEDVEMLQDLIVAAVNEAMHQIDEVSAKEMNKITGGMKLPGM